MKKIISLLLFFCMICLLLVSCNLKGFFRTSNGNESQWELPDGIIETTLAKDGISLTIAHSENFTQDDIDFVTHLHSKIRSNAPIEALPNYDLSDILSEGMRGNPIFLLHFENPYFISAYLKSDALEYELNNVGEYTFDVTKYVWCKFYDFTQIVDEIEGMELTKNTYLLYDCIIKRDIVNKVEYNKNCKCYMEYRGEYVLKRTTPDMLIYFDPGLVADVTGGSKFIFYPEFGIGSLEIHIDKNNVEYLYFDYAIYNEDGTVYKNQAKELFSEHYNYLVRNFEILNEYINNSGRIVKSAGIRLETLNEYLSDRR